MKYIRGAMQLHPLTNTHVYMCHIKIALRPRDLYIRHWTGPSFVQAMGYRLNGAEWLSNQWHIFNRIFKSNLNKIIYNIFVEEDILKTSSPKWQPLCVGLNVFNISVSNRIHSVSVAHVYWYLRQHRLVVHRSERAWRRIVVVLHTKLSKKNFLEERFVLWLHCVTRASFANQSAMFLVMARSHPCPRGYPIIIIIIIWMSLDLTDDRSTLVQVMAWFRRATSN